MLRVMVLIALASLIWTPIGIYVGLRPAPDPHRAAGGAVPGRLPANICCFRWRCR